VSATLLVAQRLRLHLPAFSVVIIWLGVLLVLTWLSAEWFWRANAPAPAVLPTQTVSDPLLAAQAIASRHLMGESLQAKAGTTSQASAQFQLTGAMTASKGRPGFAIVAEEGKTPVPVVEGEELVPGVTLSKVFANKVEISRQGRTETIEINDKAILRSGTAISVEPGVKAPENNPAPPASSGRTQ